MIVAYPFLRKAHNMNKGMLSAASAYAMWGFLPIYFKFIHDVPSIQATAHRVTWSFLFLVAVLLTRREWSAFRASLTRRTVLIFLGAALLLAVNWLVYVYAMTSGLIVEASLGYFINPLVNVVLGTLFLRERLRPTQWVPVGLAALGVIYLTFSVGSLPWIALVLAFSFGLYGLVKKVAPLGSLYGLMLETTLLFVPATGYLIYAELTGTGAFLHTGTPVAILLFLLGVVTAIPLLLFASGARSVSLTTMGLLQYISPTLQFITGILLYGEPFTPERVIGFGIIWGALAIFTTEGFLARRRAQHATYL
jgi:chloramphenicol-sensitive protein RarD